ncbi:MAG: hypothetical protein AAF352_06715, partial [Pseudomonadota bacterium]
MVDKASIRGTKPWVKDLTTGEYITDFPSDIHFIRWHPSKPLLRFIHNDVDWEVDPYAPEPENWQNINPVTLSGGWYKNQRPTNDDMHVTVWGRETSAANWDMWLVSQDGLEAEKIAFGNAKTNYWVFDQQNQPVLRLDVLNPSTERLYRKQNDSWIQIADIDVADDFYILDDVAPDGTVLARSARGRDKAALVSLDVMTGEETVLIDNPNADIGWPVKLGVTYQSDIVPMGVDTLDYAAITDRGQVFLDILSEFPQPITLGKTSPTASGRYLIQELSVQSQSFIHLLMNLDNKTYEVLSPFYFARYKEHLIQEQAVTFTARDGLEIPAILAMPEGAKDPIPFIVDIHGGPASYTPLGYNRDMQFLVNRGYGVLSVNFRGSKGFGKAFQTKGYKEFGRAISLQPTDKEATQNLVRCESDLSRRN